MLKWAVKSAHMLLTKVCNFALLFDTNNGSVYIEDEAISQEELVK